MILLRNMLVMFVVIICFAAVLVSMAALSMQGTRFLKNVQNEITARNELILQRIN